MGSQRHKVYIQGVAADGKQYAEHEARKGYWGTSPLSPGYGGQDPAKTARG